MTRQQRLSVGFAVLGALGGLLVALDGMLSGHTAVVIRGLVVAVAFLLAAVALGRSARSPER